METNISRGSVETASLASSIVQSDRYKERDIRKADSVVRNEVVYFSPVIRIDPGTSTTILQYRDSSTGKVENEYPTPQQIESYKHSAEAAQVKEPVVAAPAPAPVKAEAPKAEKKADQPKPVDVHIDSQA